MLDLHPVIRIGSFVVLTAFLALGGAASILIGAAVVFFLFVQYDGSARRAAWRMLRRMRWLFLSIALIYLWFTPGTPLFSATAVPAGWLPTIDGVGQGGLRIASLALIVAAASLLLHVTSRQQLIGALRWLLAPLRFVGFPHERISVRAALTLAAVTQAQDLVREVLAAAPESAKPWTRIGLVAAALFAVTLREAEAAPCVPITLAQQPPPPLQQWCVPLLLLAVMAVFR